MHTDDGGPGRTLDQRNADEQPLTVKTGYELEFTTDFDPASLQDGEHVQVLARNGITYDRCFNSAEFKERGLKVVGVMAGYRWKRPSSPNQDEVPA